MNLADRCPTIEHLTQQIPGLRFIELLGRGGSGWTFLATQESLSRQVAVKILPRRETRLDNSVARFRQEAESLAKLNHPSIVTVHDFGVADDYLYLTMEYVAGPTLRHRMQAGKMSVQRVLDVAQEICDAVQCAHDAGILHRDIKPENILFVSNDADAKVKVADFGIARLLTSERNDQLTMTGMLVGTPFYMAPEQNEIDGGVEQRSDVYSIGVVVYEMLTGRLPLGRFPAPSEFCDCSPQVDHAVWAALENRPVDRMRSPHLLAAQLAATDIRRRGRTWTLPVVFALFTLASLCAIAIGIGWLMTHSQTINNSSLNEEVTAVERGNEIQVEPDVETDIKGGGKPEVNPFEEFLLPLDSADASKTTQQ